MALSDVSVDHLALSNGGHHPLSANGTAAPPNTITLISNSQDPLTAASSSDGDEHVTVKDLPTKVHQKPQRSLVVQRTNRPRQNGGVVKQNGSVRNLSPSSAPTANSSSVAVTESQRLASRHLPSTHSPPPSSPPPLQPPPLCCQHCHVHSTLCCPCGQQDCPLFQNPGTGTGPGSVPPHPGTTSSCPCCLSACTYSHPNPHPPHSSSPLCLHQHHHQRWQEHLQNHTHPTGIRSGDFAADGSQTLRTRRSTAL